MERMTVEQIAEEALSLPSEDRALLADRLVESLDPSDDDRIWRLWADEAIRRRDEIRSGRVQSVREKKLSRVSAKPSLGEIPVPSGSRRRMRDLGLSFDCTSCRNSMNTSVYS